MIDAAMNWKRYVVFVLVASLGTAIWLYQSPSNQPEYGAVRLVDTLPTSSVQERASIKADAIMETDAVGRFTDTKTSLTIEIESVRKIDDGVEVFARAWQGKQQIGFGANHSVDLERFIIHNPPILVEDPTGPIVETWEGVMGDTKTRRLREDPKAALYETLAHTIKVSGQPSNRIVSGSRGNTTSTFYPNANPESTSVDGRSRWTGTATTFATACSNNGTSADDSGVTIYPFIRSTAVSNQWNLCERGHFLFDTSAIPDTDVVSSATFSLDGAADKDNPFSLSINIYSTNPASNTAIAASDHQTVGTTAYATALAQSGLSDAAYNDWTLNATGLAAISLTGVTKFSEQYPEDAADSGPTWQASKNQYWAAHSADTTGTATDPKLVVVHSAAAGATARPKPDVIIE